VEISRSIDRRLPGFVDLVPVRSRRSKARDVPRHSCRGSERICPSVIQPWKEMRRIERAMDRSKRANNPECFDDKGRWKKGARMRVRSKRFARSPVNGESENAVSPASASEVRGSLPTASLAKDPLASARGGFTQRQPMLCSAGRPASTSSTRVRRPVETRRCQKSPPRAKRPYRRAFGARAALMIRLQAGGRRRSSCLAHDERNLCRACAQVTCRLNAAAIEAGFRERPTPRRLG